MDKYTTFVIAFLLGGGLLLVIDFIKEVKKAVFPSKHKGGKSKKGKKAKSKSWFYGAVIGFILLTALNFATANYTAGINYPPKFSDIPFRFYELHYWINDSFEAGGDCVLMSCDLNVQYTNRDILIRTTDNYFNQEICGGNNSLTHLVSSNIDFEDSAGNWHSMTPRIQTINLTCTNSNTNESVTTIGEYYASIPSMWTNFFFILTWLIILLGVIYLAYSDYGVLVAVGGLVLTRFVIAFLAVEGIVNMIFIQDIVVLLFILADILFLLSITRMAFETKAQAMEEL